LRSVAAVGGAQFGRRAIGDEVELLGAAVAEVDVEEAREVGGHEQVEVGEGDEQRGGELATVVRSCRWLLMTAALLAGACHSASSTRSCMTLGEIGPIAAAAAAFRVDVYGGSTACVGSAVASDAGAPLSSHVYRKGQPITLDEPAGTYTLMLTTYGDDVAMLQTGHGCAMFNVTPGENACIDLPVVAPPDLAVAPPVCGDPSWLLCENFEAPMLDQRWLRYQGDGFVALDTARAHDGTTSLQAHVEPSTTGGHATVFTQLVFPRPDVFVRMFVFLPSLPTMRTFLSTLLQKDAPYSSTQLILEGGALGTSNSGDGTTRVSTTTAPVRRWFCLEWQIHFDANRGGSSVWIDGQPLTLPVGVENTAPTPFYYFLRIGAESFSTTATDLWIDNVAVASTRIGCGS
jgi:hypothetical protein